MSNKESAKTSPEKPARKPRDSEGTIERKTRLEKRGRGGREREVEYFIVRVRVVDALGKVRQKKRTRYSKSEALETRRSLRAELIAEIAAEREKIERPPEKTFFELLALYEKDYLSEAKYIGDCKISGQRDPLHHTTRMIKDFRAFFGDVPLSQINYNRLREFKQHTEAVPVVIKRAQYEPLSAVELAAIRRANPQSRARRRKKYVEEIRVRKPATVHRILSKLRRILSVGVQHDYLAVNPFEKGDPLISTAIEETRVRICSFDEEARLLAVCTGGRAHLKNIIICAIDTFLRENELFQLCWSDVDLEKRIITARKETTKTQKARSVPLTSRAARALADLRPHAPDPENGLIFGIKSVRNSWETARRLAQVDGLRWHDLRATGITRLLEAGVREAIVMQFSGHEKYETFQKYVRKDLQILQNAGEALDALYERQNKPERENVPNNVPNVVGYEQFLEKKRAAG